MPNEGTTGAIYAADDYGAENVTTYASGNLAVEGLKTGKVDCVIIDNEPAKAYVKTNEGLKILDTEYANEDYAIAIAKENTELMDKVNSALEELIADGELQKIIDKYIPRRVIFAAKFKGRFTTALIAVLYRRFHRQLFIYVRKKLRKIN